MGTSYYFQFGVRNVSLNCTYNDVINVDRFNTDEALHTSKTTRLHAESPRNNAQYSIWLQGAIFMHSFKESRL